MRLSSILILFTAVTFSLSLPASACEKKYSEGSAAELFMKYFDRGIRTPFPFRTNHEARILEMIVTRVKKLSPRAKGRLMVTLQAGAVSRLDEKSREELRQEIIQNLNVFGFEPGEWALTTYYGSSEYAFILQCNGNVVTYEADTYNP